MLNVVKAPYKFCRIESNRIAFCMVAQMSSVLNSGNID